MISTQDVETLPGTPVVDSDGDRVGDVAQVYVSDDGAQPLFVTVKTGFFGTKESFVPLDDASLDGSGLHVSYDKAVIKDAPRVEADEHLSDDEQSSLFDYYDQHAAGAPADRGRTVGRSGTDSDAGGVQDETALGADSADAPIGSEQDRTTSQPTDAGFATPLAGTAGADTGRDTSGPNTDDAMTLSEERLKVGVQQVETGRARLRKHIVTEQRTVTVPVSHDEVRIEREPITDANVDAATDGPELSEEEHEVVLTEERPVVDTEVVPVERVRLATDTVTEQREVSADVRHEEVDTDGVDGATDR